MKRMGHHRYHKRRHHRNFRTHNKTSSFNRMSYFTRKHPIATGILLIIASFILFRLSFTNTFLNSSEIFIWSLLVSIGLFIAGILVLIGWWRNHISMMTTRHNVNWRHR